MQDEEINQVVEEAVVVDESQATESEETVGQDEEVEQVQEVEDEPEEAVAEQPSRRETLRIQTLLAKYGSPAERTQQAPSQRSDALDYQTALDADPETIRQLQADRQAEGDRRYNDGLAQVQTVKWETFLNMDAPQVESQYEILNPKSPNFYPAVSDALSKEYLHMVGFDQATGLVANPGIRWKDFVESKFELADAIASNKNAATVKNVAKQAASTGLRPDGSSAKRTNLNKDAQDMSMEELYASIGQKYKK